MKTTAERIVICFLLFATAFASCPAFSAPPDPNRGKAEYRLFFGLDDPQIDTQVTRRIELCQELGDTIRKWQEAGRLDTKDPTVGRLGAIGHTAEALWFGTELGTLLRDRGAPQELGMDGNYYAKITEEPEKRLLQSIIASRGNVTPAALMHMALQATNGNYTLATLTAHNFLKGVAYRGRGLAVPGEALDMAVMKNNGYDYIIPVSQKLINLRGDPSKGDKFGPWYHMFGVLFVGSITNHAVATSMTAAEQFTRHLLTEELGIKSYSPIDREKADWDGCGISTMRALHPVIYSGKPRPPLGPEPPLPSEPKRLVLLSATVTPAEGAPGTEFTLNLQYGVEGARADAPVAVEEQVRVSGAQALPLPAKTRVLDKERIVRVSYTGRFQKPGDYAWNFSATAPDHAPLSGQAAFRVTENIANVSRSVLFLIDTSGSMSGQRLADAKKAASAARPAAQRKSGRCFRLATTTWPCSRSSPPTRKALWPPPTVWVLRATRLWHGP
jgi:hypothetical protein